MIRETPNPELNDTNKFFFFGGLWGAFISITQGFAPDSEGVFTFDIQTGISTHSRPVSDCIHHPESVSPPSCSQLSPLQPESRMMLLPYQRWRCLQLRGERKKKTKERPGEEGEGWTVSFDWLAADGTPGVFISRRRLISGACKSTWQVFTGAVNPADSIHFANCSDAASLCGEDQTLALFSPR